MELLSEKETLNFSKELLFFSFFLTILMEEEDKHSQYKQIANIFCFIHGGNIEIREKVK